jgi:hypothetical protein
MIITAIIPRPGFWAQWAPAIWAKSAQDIK